MKKLKNNYLAFMKGKTGSVINVILYIAASNAVVGLATYFQALDLTGQPEWYAASIGIVNAVLVLIKILLKK